MKRHRRERAYQGEDGVSPVMAELLSKAKEDDSRPQRTLSAGIVAPISEEQDSNPCGKVVIYIPDNGRDPGMVKTE